MEKVAPGADAAVAVVAVAVAVVAADVPTGIDAPRERAEFRLTRKSIPLFESPGPHLTGAFSWAPINQGIARPNIPLLTDRRTANTRFHHGRIAN